MYELVRWGRVNNITDKIIEIVAQVGNQPRSGIRPETTLEELAIASLDAVTITFEIEEEFNIKVPDERVFTFETVGDLIQGVEEELAKNS